MPEPAKKGTGKASTRAKRTIRNSGVKARIRKVIGKK